MRNIALEQLFNISHITWIFIHLLHIIINIIIELSLLICTYPHDLSREAYCKYKSEISEHGAFPLVSVRVWHGEPGNVHPYNFEPISPAKTFFWAKLL